MAKRGQDPRLVEIAKWRNKATKEEFDWIEFAWGWFDYNIRREMYQAESLKACFRQALKSGEIFSTSAWVILDNSVEEQELTKRFGGTRAEAPNARCISFSSDAPRLTRESYRKLGDVLGVIFELWEEGLLDEHLNHPRLKQCCEPTCKKWFAVSKEGQKYCNGEEYPPCREVASRGKPGEDSPRRKQYLNRQAEKMELIRERRNKDKDRESKERDQETLRQLRNRRKRSSMQTI